MLVLIRGLVLVGSVGLTALRSGYQALVRSFMRSVAQKEAMQKAIEKMKTQVKEAAPKNLTHKSADEFKSIIEKIGRGHAWDRHVIKQKEFPEIKTKEDFINHIEKTIKSKETEHRFLKDDREAFWNKEDNTVIIYDPSHEDFGTVQRPKGGPDRPGNYFRNLK